MYGTVARMRVKPGHEAQLQALANENVGQSPPPGFVASYIFRTDADPHEMVLVAIFRDRESYHANAASPEQDREYRQLREHLEADPAWTDGEVVFHASGEPA